MKIGIYVGSFNPVHKGHIKIVEFLINNSYLDKVIIIPTLGYYQKNIDTSLSDRVEMLKFYQSDRIIIDTKYNSLSYTYQIISELRKESNDELFLIIGADNLVNFHMWKNVDKILELSKVIVIKRNGIDVSKYIKDKNKFIVMSDIEEINISSSLIREFISLGKYDKLYNVMDDFVIKYILNNKLYGSD